MFNYLIIERRCFIVRKIFSIIKMCVDFLQNLIESIITAKKEKE